MAEINLQAHDNNNVTLVLGDAARGWPKHEFYDVIVLAASAPVLPKASRKSLKPGGRVIAIIVREEPVMEALLVTCIVLLANAQQSERFVF